VAVAGAVAAVVGAVKEAVGVPFGVNYLWDPVATVALGALVASAHAADIVIGTNGKPGNPRVTAAEMLGEDALRKKKATANGIGESANS